jgi:hypothetical protein
MTTSIRTGAAAGLLVCSAASVVLMRCRGGVRSDLPDATGALEAGADGAPAPPSTPDHSCSHVDASFVIDKLA